MYGHFRSLNDYLRGDQHALGMLIGFSVFEGTRRFTVGEEYQPSGQGREVDEVRFVYAQLADARSTLRESPESDATARLHAILLPRKQQLESLLHAGTLSEVPKGSVGVFQGIMHMFMQKGGAPEDKLKRSGIGVYQRVIRAGDPRNFGAHDIAVRDFRYLVEQFTR